MQTPSSSSASAFLVTTFEFGAQGPRRLCAVALGHLLIASVQRRSIVSVSNQLDIANLATRLFRPLPSIFDLPLPGILD